MRRAFEPSLSSRLPSDTSSTSRVDLIDGVVSVQESFEKLNRDQVELPASTSSGLAPDGCDSKEIAFGGQVTGLIQRPIT